MSDSDTDSDCLSSVNNVFGFPNESTIVARGPHVDSTLNLNLNTNSLVMPRNMEQRRLADLSVQPRNFQSSFRGFAQSSMISGRAPSPTMSMCSNISTSESIVAALRSGRFNKHELRSMSDAFNKLTKGRIRKRMARRRNRKLFLKGARRQSGYDSGNLGSDSSISSDDCRSTRTGITAMNRCSRSIYANSRGRRSNDDARSIDTDVNELRRTIKDQTMVRNCTEHLKKDSFKNIFGLGPRSFNNASMNRMQNKNTTVQNMLQKDRFLNSFLLPSQRFAQSKSVLPIPEECNENLFQVKKKPPIITTINQRIPSNHNNSPTDCDKDDSIFSEATDPENSILKHPDISRKRNLNSSDDSICSENKKIKLSAPKSATEKVAAAFCQDTNSHTKETFNDFVFAKPQAPPVRNLSSMKKQEHVVQTVEKSKSLTAYKAPIKKPLSPIKKPLSPIKKPQERTSLDQYSETMQSSNSEVSMRPSFMKRKLFTQTLDVTENKSVADSSPSVSPAKGYSELPKEKNKARKLVTSQSCLSRDIPCDENNLLYLIHKIVPPDRMNVTTNTTQKKEVHPHSTDATVKNSNVIEEKDCYRWDVTAVLSNCRDGDHSDTYTDEEIFVVHDKKESKKKIIEKNTVDLTQCSKSPLKKKPATRTCTVEKLNEVKENKEKTKETKKTVYNYAHAFWNCDSESEGQETPKQQKFTKESRGNVLTKQIGPASKSKNSLVKNIKSVLDSTKSSNDSSINLEDIGKNIQTLTSNRSLRIKAAKAMKEKSMNSPKPCPREELQQSIRNTLKEGKSIRNHSSSSTKSSHPKKPVKKKEENVKLTWKTQQSAKKTSPSETKVSQNQKNCIDTRSKLSTTNKSAIVLLTRLTKDEIESPHLDFTGRLRQLSNAAIAPVSSLQHDSTSLRFETMSSNAAKRGRGRLRKLPNNTSNNTYITCFNKDEIESPHQDFTRRGRPRKLSNTANATAPALEQGDSSLQGERMSSNVSKRDRGRPRKLPNNTSNTTVKDLTTDIGTNNVKNKTAKASEKPKLLGTNKTTRSRILETPKKSNIELSSKLKASKKKVATDKNTAKLEQHKGNYSKELKQAPHKTDKDNNKGQPKKTVLPKNVMEVMVQPKNATKENTKEDKKVLRNSILQDYFCRRTRSSREKSFLVKASPTKTKAAKTQKKEPLKLPQTKASTKIADDSRTSDKENTSHNSTYGKSRRLRKNASMFQCCEADTPKRDRSRDFSKPKLPLQKAVGKEKLVEAPSSPSVSKSFRSVRDRRQVTTFKLNLSIAKATIGVAPRHCVAEEPCKTMIDDDIKSVTARSITSTSTMSRSRRPKFLHVW